MIRYFLAEGDRAGPATIIEGLPDTVYAVSRPAVHIATLEMRTYCTACKSQGYIAPRGPRWPGTASNGKGWALSGDINICGCNPPPVFYAERTMTMTFTAEEAAQLTGGWRAVATPAAAAHQDTERSKHICWCHVCDSETGEPLRNRDYVADVGGVKQSGQTDGDGYAKIETVGAQSFAIHVIFSSPRRTLKPQQGA